MSGWISPREFSESEGVGDWRVLGEGACACFRTGSYAAGARLVRAIASWTGWRTTIPTSTFGTTA